MPINKGMMSSKTVEWATPNDFFDKLNRVFQFTLDPCATKENAKCHRFFTAADDGLSKPWGDGVLAPKPSRVFMNPPYGRGIGAWVKKAYEEATGGGADVVVCLLPARTDTRWWHEWCAKGIVRFIPGRLHFNDADPAPFPSALVIFSKHL